MAIKFILMFCGLNVTEDGVESESFTMVSIDSLLFMKTNIICKYI